MVLGILDYQKTKILIHETFLSAILFCLGMFLLQSVASPSKKITF
jgi:hypothetical protein